MWYGHHPFFLFLIPGLISEKFEKEQVKKQMREEQDLQRQSHLQNTNEDKIKSDLDEWRKIHKESKKKGKMYFRLLGLSLLFFFISLLGGEGSLVVQIFLIPGVFGLIFFGFKSLPYAAEIEDSSNAICILEGELRRRGRVIPDDGPPRRRRNGQDVCSANYAEPKIQMSEYNEYLGSGKDLGS